MDKPNYTKIALLIIILAEEIRNAKKPVQSVKMNVSNDQLKQIVENCLRPDCYSTISSSKDFKEIRKSQIDFL